MCLESTLISHHWPPRKAHSDMHPPQSRRSLRKTTHHPPLESTHPFAAVREGLKLLVYEVLSYEEALLQVHERECPERRAD